MTKQFSFFITHHVMYEKRSRN